MVGVLGNYLRGDLYEREEGFSDFVKARSENTVKEWLQSVNCPVIRIDGTLIMRDSFSLRY